MAVTYGFYNSLNKDRVYNAEQMSSIFNGIITDGVFASIGGSLMPIAGTGMQVVVKTGKCWFNSTWTLNDALLPLDIPASDVSLTRIDAIVVEINSAVSMRANTIKVVKGTPSANPAKPTLANTETLHQYALGYVTVSAGVTSITADKIEVNVGKTTCPFITSVLQQTDITALFNQWDAEFNAWFANVQAQLSGNVAANLQRQIDELKIATGSKITKSTSLAANLPENASVDEALRLIGASVYLSKIQKAQCVVSVKYSSGSPVKHVLITGLTDLDGNDLYTDDTGVAIGYCGTGTYQVGIKDYADIEDSLTTLNAIIGNTYSIDLTVNTRNFLALTSSKSVRFSKNVKQLNYSVVGGGGGGGSGGQYGILTNQSWGYTYGGGGGGSGYAETVKNASFEHDKSYPCTVGSAGKGGVVTGPEHSQVGADGSSGGRSSFMGTTANGGNGGKFHDKTQDTVGGAGGNGMANGGTGACYKDAPSSYKKNGTSGGNSSKQIYTAYETLTLSGGGGGGGMASSDWSHNGIASGGSNGLAKNTYGSGGSGGSAYEYDDYDGEDHMNLYRLSSGDNGLSGVVTLSMTLTLVS